MKSNQSLQKLCNQSALYLKKHSSTILTCIGAIGVVGTAVTAVRATPEAVRLIEQTEYEKGEELTKLEIVKLVGPAYIPSILIGASTITCIFGANALNKRQQAALVSAYALVDNSYKEYRAKVKELFGEEADIKVREAIAKDHCEDKLVYCPGCNPINTNGERHLFYEEYRGKYFESTMEAVINAEYHFNRNFAMRGYANLNEFYEFLGLSETKEGDVLGWNSWELMEGGLSSWIDFDHHKTELEDGIECYMISMPIPPVANYEELW